MTTQDNNEAAIINTPEFWRLTRKHATAPEGEKRDAAAKAVLDYIGSHLAHVARQRQESAAVSEGVDTADELPQPAWQFIGPDGEQRSAYSAEQMAQQREAGRRERDAEVVEAKREGMEEAQELLQNEVDQAPEPLRRLGEYLSGVLDEDEFKTADRMILGVVKAVAALYRQPVSEGLTDERKKPLSLALWCDLKTDADRSSWLLMGRGYETGVVAQAVQNDLAMAYHRLSLLSAVPPAKAEGMSAAARDVLAERQRQVNAEGWTPLHDDKYCLGELSMAAACYALIGNVHMQTDVPQFWPWSKEWWKPSDERRNLVKAGALILAEIDRIDRAILAQQAKGAKP